MGSRTIREEIDALEVLEISAIRRLAVPCLEAAMVVGLVLTGLVCFIGLLAGYLFNTYARGGAPGSRPRPDADQGGGVRGDRRRGPLRQG